MVLFKIALLILFLMVLLLLLVRAPSSGTNNIFVYFLELSGGTITPASENKVTLNLVGCLEPMHKSLGADITILATENAQVTGSYCR